MQAVGGCPAPPCLSGCKRIPNVRTFLIGMLTKGSGSLYKLVMAIAKLFKQLNLPDVRHHIIYKHFQSHFSTLMLLARDSSSVDINPANSQFSITSHGSDWLWAVFALFSVGFLGHGALAYYRDPKQRLPHLLNMFITFFLSVTYFTMASNLGSTDIQAEFNYTRLADNLPETGTRQIFYAKYIGWFLAYPLVIAEVGLASVTFLNPLLSAVFAQEIFVVMLLIGSLVHSSYKWGYFVYSLVGGFIVLFELTFQFPRTAGDFKNKALVLGGTFGALTVCQWIQWALTDGSSVIGLDSSTIFWGIIDLFQFLIFPAFTAWYSKDLEEIAFPAFHEKKDPRFSNVHSVATAAEPQSTPAVAAPAAATPATEV